jgi:hypothetical protein
MATFLMSFFHLRNLSLELCFDRSDKRKTVLSSDEFHLRLGWGASLGFVEFRPMVFSLSTRFGRLGGRPVYLFGVRPQGRCVCVVEVVTGVVALESL